MRPAVTLYARPINTTLSLPSQLLRTVLNISNKKPPQCSFCEERPRQVHTTRISKVWGRAVTGKRFIKHFLYTQEQSETVSRYGLRFLLLPKVNGDFLVQGTSAIKFSLKSDHSLQRYKPNCGKMPYLTILQKIPGSGSGGR